MKRWRRQRWAWFGLVLLLVAAIGGYGYWANTRPLPAIVPAQAVGPLAVQTPAASLEWPAEQTAVGILGSGILPTHGTQTPLPTASTAKMITVLTVLQKKPLLPNQTGPIITLTASDVALYNSYTTADGSVVPVQAGEQISEYQMLQAILLPSANNMADSLAIWAFGSLSAYQAAANSYLAGHSLEGTHVGSDASGLNPSTTSTAHDLVKIGETLMQNPVLASIVSQPSASDIPVAGTIKNVNYLLGSNGIVGIKTGNSDQAGGVFVSASDVSVNGKPQTIVTALVGASTLTQSMSDSLPLIQSAQANFKSATITTAGQKVGNYKVPWADTIPAVATGNLSLAVWAGSSLPATVQLHSLHYPVTSDQSVGTVSTSGGAFSSNMSVGVKLQTAVPKPSLWWRLTHPNA